MLIQNFKKRDHKWENTNVYKTKYLLHEACYVIET